MLSDETMVFQQLFKIRAFCLFQSLLERDFLRQAADRRWVFRSEFVQRSCAGADVIRAAPDLRHSNAIQFPFSRSKAPQEPW